MSSKTTALLFLISFFSCILLFLYFGTYLAQRYAKQKLIHRNYGLQVVEGAIFALLGLIVAFTFSSANQRFDARRYLITQEANAIRAAYLLVDLTSPGIQNRLRQDFHQFVASELATYTKSSQFDAYVVEHNNTLEIQKRIWQLAIKECVNKKQQYGCSLFLSALNNMFDVSNTRYANAEIHPPWIIFSFLIGLALLGALLAGYDMEEQGKGKALYLFSYAFVIAITVYIVIDLEFPRLGFIRVDSFDTVLTQLQVLMMNSPQMM